MSAAEPLPARSSVAGLELDVGAVVLGCSDDAQGPQGEALGAGRAGMGDPGQEVVGRVRRPPGGGAGRGEYGRPDQQVIPCRVRRGRLRRYRR